MSFNAPFLMLDVRSIRAILFSLLYLALSIVLGVCLAHGIEVRKPKFKIILVSGRGRVTTQVTMFPS